MKKYILLLLLGTSLFSSRAQPPNNPIFFGGSGDGSNGTAYTPAFAAIFRGSAGDGAGQSSNGAASNILFAGGAGDGISAASNGAIANSIFLGSTGDGISGSSNGAIANNIFSGGGGDGWHAVIFPMGPLPVKLLSFTAVHSGTAHLVKWVTTQEINTHHFEVQRSANGSDFITAGNATPAGSPSAGASYSFTVWEPWQGNNFYRLKIVDEDGSFEYSSVVLLKNMEGWQVAVYPNPAADQLYVRLPAGSVTVVNAAIYDASGKMVLQPLLKAGIANAIDISRLAAGLYTLQCITGDKNMTLRFMKTQ